MSEKPEIVIDEEFEAILPPLSAETKARLEKDLDANGQQDTIKVWKEEGIVLDGHNRLYVLDTLEREPRFEYISLPDRDAAKRWILDRALAHRHLTPAQLDYVRGKRYELEKKDEGRPEKRVQNEHVSEGRTCETLAEEMGVSASTIKRNAEFANALDTIAEKVGPEIKQAILSRELKVKKAYIPFLARASARELKKAFSRDEIDIHAPAEMYGAPCGPPRPEPAGDDGEYRWRLQDYLRSKIDAFDVIIEKLSVFPPDAWEMLHTTHPDLVKRWFEICDELAAPLRSASYTEDSAA